MTPVALFFFCILVLLLIFLPRQYAALPLIVSVFYMTNGPRLDLGTLTFYVNRLLILVGILRIVLKNEWSSGSLTKIDKALYLWIVCMIITGSLLSFDLDTIINRFAIGLDAFGFYFLLKIFVRDIKDIKIFLQWIPLILFPLALMMLYERFFSYNLFSILGGVSESVVFRGGRPRSQGPFAHSITAGTAGATSIGFIIAFYLNNSQAKFISFIGVLSSLIIVYTSNSSGPIVSLLLIGVGIYFWKFRYHMKNVQLVFISSLLVLSVFMKAPIWYLISRIDLTGSSGGWHRAELINSAIKYFDEWWLLGTNYTRHWMATGVGWSQDHTDITNQYIKMGVIGGIFTMISFINIIVQGFSVLGQKIKTVTLKRNDEWTLWILGTILFSHTITFLSVSYFDQTINLFYLLIAFISVIEKSVKE